VNNFAEVGESSLENPLPWDTIAATNYVKLNLVESYVEELRKRSEKRTSTEKDFLYIKDEIERFKKILAEKSVSMNEAVRLKEKQEADERSKARKKELVSRPEPKETVWDITLKLAAEPGLPDPTPYTNMVKHTVSAGPFNRPSETATKGKFTVDKSGNKVATKSATNTVDLAGNKSKTGDEDEDEADKTPAVDATLDEATRILTDYIQLFPKPHALADTTSSSK
jgi:carboxyl-terminal processing protease